MDYKILIVDDEADITRMLKTFFEQRGFLVYMAHDGEEALEKVKAKPDIILLDINMPRLSGLEVLERIREHVHVPILFVTAKIEEKDKVAGLMAGGDDYITKPFSLRELEARVLAHLRRDRRPNGPADFYVTNECVIDFSGRKVSLKNQEIKLTKTEFDIIEILSTSKGRIFSKEDIYEKLWGYEKEGDNTIITEHIRRIRNKFSRHSGKEQIETVWGVGYRWIG